MASPKILHSWPRRTTDAANDNIQRRAALRARAWGPGPHELATAGVAGCQRFLDESTGVLERAHLSVDPRLDLLESPALRSAGCSVAVVSRERTDYLVDREAQLLELAGQPNPFDISLDERAVATGGAGSRSQDTATTSAKSPIFMGRSLIEHSLSS